MKITIKTVKQTKTIWKKKTTTHTPESLKYASQHKRKQKQVFKTTVNHAKQFENTNRTLKYASEITYTQKLTHTKKLMQNNWQKNTTQREHSNMPVKQNKKERNTINKITVKHTTQFEKHT